MVAAVEVEGERMTSWTLGGEKCADSLQAERPGHQKRQHQKTQPLRPPLQLPQRLRR